MAAVIAASVFVLNAAAAHAEVPSGKLVMLDVLHRNALTNELPPSNEVLTFREVVEAGFNGIHHRPWESPQAATVEFPKFVAQAHEYGLWVAGGAAYFGDSQPFSNFVTLAKNVGSAGVDFIQIDEPMGYNMTEAQYQELKAAARSNNPNCPVIITDVFYNDKVSAFASCDGLAQEIYVDAWYPSSLDKLDAYKQAHPDKAALVWIWLLEAEGNPCKVYPDSKFDLWFTASLNRVGKVILFIFEHRDLADPCSGWSANWAKRVPTIQAATANWRQPLPTWTNFSPTSAAASGAPDVSVTVQNAAVGLDPTSAKVSYSTDGGATWTAWSAVDCTGTVGTKAAVTITAHHVPFNQVSTTQNRVRFKITDTYVGTYYRNARTDTVFYNVPIASIPAPDAGTTAPSDADVADAPADAPQAGATSPALVGGCGCSIGAQSSSRFELFVLVALAAFGRRRHRRNGRQARASLRAAPPR